MPTPPKPANVLKLERRSHRTKDELDKREKGEKSLLTRKKLTERPEVKANPTAHKEYRRVKGLMEGIKKNDALYTGIINRYCLIYAECQELEQRREEFRRGMGELREEREKNGISASEYFSLLDKMQKNINTLDSLCGQKRKMLLDIEKECVMTIAAALRSIPKKVEEEQKEQKDPMETVLERKRA